MDKIDPELAAMWISQEVNRQLNYRGIDLRESRLNADIMGELLSLLQNNEITEIVGKKLLERIIDTGESPIKIVEEEGLRKVSGQDKLQAVVGEVIAENPGAISDYKSGKPESLNFLMGKVMQKMKGSADPGVVIGLLKERLD
ncbi:MAG: hypothetical protein A7316_06620 [Candidatus Altiarchaeales archaeon WOR_SM1_86-2]|nr:MAG: hypothetical protein A7316_06620 [Candidatus Altiarchaeales archaeon WOR_SM1_86-2]